MPISIRVISIIDQKYTVEVEVEEDDWITIWKQLKNTAWGRRVLKLVVTMLPDYIEVEENVSPETEEKTEEESTSETL